MAYLVMAVWLLAPLVFIRLGLDWIGIWNALSTPAKVFTVLMGVNCAAAVYLTLREAIRCHTMRARSRQYAPAVAGALREYKIADAIEISDRYIRSHLARTVRVGLIELRKRHGRDGPPLDAIQRAMKQAEYAVMADLAQAIRTLFLLRVMVCTFGGACVLIRLASLMNAEAAGLMGWVTPAFTSREVFVGVALTTYAVIPAVTGQNHVEECREAFQVEMSNSESELIDYFIKRYDKLSRPAAS
jgi:biopolymer transport protein ExbB/biopolymer transport protein TolQ